MIGLICIRIYRWYLERKTKPDSVDRVENLAHQLYELELRNYRLEKQMEELLVDTGKARRVGYVPIPDDSSKFSWDMMTYPYTKAGYFVRSEGERIAIYELPARYSRI